MAPRIAVSAGHHNADGGGHPGEQELVAPITSALCKRLHQLGADVRCITPDEGYGYHPHGLQQAAAECCLWSEQGWTPNLFIEIHAEGNNRGDKGRGCFAIYPDSDKHNDIDTTIQKDLGPQLAKAVQQATGIPPRNGGIMSERNTAVGGKGYRLGVFYATTPVRKTTARAIFEVGSLTSPADTKILSQPGFPEKCGRALAEAIARFYDLQRPVSGGDTVERYLNVTVLGYQSFNIDRTINIIEARENGEYTQSDINLIVRAYDTVCKKVEADPRVPIAQCMHETAFLSSPWAARPHRNPAGIGVTGEPDIGLSFDSWVDHAIPAHVGRLLAYALPAGQGTDSQKALIEEALTVRPLPNKYRGAAKAVKDFGNGIWAVDPKYAAKLAKMCVALF